MSHCNKPRITECIKRILRYHAITISHCEGENKTKQNKTEDSISLSPGGFGKENTIYTQWMFVCWML